MFTMEEKDRLLKRVDDIHLILTGNGHPEEGLLYKNQKNTEFRMFWMKFGWMILGGVAGIPCTVIATIFLKP